MIPHRCGASILPDQTNWCRPNKLLILHVLAELRQTIHPTLLAFHLSHVLLPLVNLLI